MNLWRRKPLRRTVGLSFLLAVILGVFYCGARFGRYYERYEAQYPGFLP
jgi:hypothetical protein